MRLHQDTADVSYSKTLYRGIIWRNSIGERYRGYEGGY